MIAPVIEGMKNQRLAAAVAVMAVAMAVLTSSSIGAAHPGHPQKQLFVDRWNTSVNIASIDTYYAISCSGGPSCITNYQNVWNASRYQWNNDPDGTWMNNYQVIEGESSEISMRVEQTSGCCSLQGLSFCISSGTYGYTWLLVESGGGHSNCDTTTRNGDCFPFGNSTPAFIYTHAGINLNEFMLTNQSIRQGVMVHELGHAFSLAHEPYDSACPSSGGNISIMDYDCLFGSYTNGVESRDTCGVNHAYYDPGRGYLGC